MSVLTVIAVIAVIALVIGRQLMGEALRGKRLIVLPVVLIVIGVLNLAHSPPMNVADIACIATSGLIAAGIGIGQGASMRLESRDGGLWGQMPARSLWLWGALVLSRVAVTVLAFSVGAHAATSVDSILFVLGVNRLMQAAVITVRAMAAGIPFATEKNGTTFLPGLLGQQSSVR
jgi:hypothetical protein